jgi:uncharacterized protein YecE (DUF72 family)
VQLPPNLRLDLERLRATLDAFPARARVALEPRHDSWHTDPVYEALAAHDAALCWWDRRSRHGPLVRTASWCYLRLHEGRTATPPGYGTRALRTWVGRLADTWGNETDGYVYFNNDHLAFAVRDARTFRRLAGDAGLALAPSPRAA